MTEAEGRTTETTDPTSGPGAFLDRVLMFTDVEGSSRRWDDDADTMRALMRHHDALVTSVVERFGGDIGARTGDGAIALFPRAVDAARSALELQTLIADGPSVAGLTSEPLRVRVGLHRGVVEHRDGEHYGPPMHRASRVMAAGHGGQILASAVVADELRAAMSADPGCVELTIVSRGVQRLKGFHEPERLSELCRRDAPAEVRGLRDVASIGNLPPIDVRSLVGRDTEVARILPEVRVGHMTTLVGTGGVGKTRLALQLAELAQDQFHDGVWFVDLASVSSAERVVTAVADTIGVVEESSQPLTASVRHAVHTRQMLLVLDNCEHVFESVTALVRAVCSDRMPTSVLATSQRALGVAGERVEQVAPLPWDAGGAGRESGDGDSPAAGMFLLAARRGDPSFQPGPGDGAVIARICRRLDGLPLALELAASRVRVMSLGEIADRLETSFDLLRSRDGVERHRTMSAAIQWSMDLLSPEDRSLLVDLSVFNGDITWDGAAAVSGLDPLDVADSLDELSRRSLLVRRGEGLRMLVPLRLFCGAELAASGREPTVRARHAAWVRASIPTPFDDPDPQVVASRLDWMMQASDDLDAAHRWLVAHRVEDAVSMSVELFDAYMARARYSIALERAADCDLDTTPPALRVEALGSVAGFAWMLGRYDEGDRAAVRALDMAREHGLPLPLMAAVLHCAFSDPATAAALADAIEAQILGEDPERQWVEKARHFAPLGMVIAVAGDPERGARIADEGVADARRVGALLTLNALGNRIMIQPGSDEVAAMMGEVVDLARTMGRKTTLAQAYVSIAHRARRAGDIAGFLAGIVQTAELVLDDDRQMVVQMLHWVPTSVLDRFPREAALMTAALGSLGEEEHYIGAEKHRARRDQVREQLAAALGGGELERAWAEGSALGLAQVIDRLHWMADAYSS